MSICTIVITIYSLSKQRKEEMLWLSLKGDTTLHSSCSSVRKRNYCTSLARRRRHNVVDDWLGSRIHHRREGRDSTVQCVVSTLVCTTPTDTVRMSSDTYSCASMETVHESISSIKKEKKNVGAFSRVPRHAVCCACAVHMVFPGTTVQFFVSDREWNPTTSTVRTTAE